MVNGTLALLVAAQTLFPDRQLPVMTVLLMLLIEVRANLIPRVINDRAFKKFC